MKTKEENEKFEEMGKKVVDLLRVAYEDSEIYYSYDEERELYIFTIDGIAHAVNVNWSSVKAGLRDIAKQLLSEDLYV